MSRIDTDRILEGESKNNLERFLTDEEINPGKRKFNASKRGLISLLVIMSALLWIGLPGDGTLAPKPESIATGQPDVFLKGGVDIPIGEYLVKGSGTAILATEGTGNSASFTDVSEYRNSWYTYIDSGDYFSFTSGEMYLAKNINGARDIDGVLTEGMYKVGKDLEPGEYKLVAKNNKASYTIYSDSSHSYISKTEQREFVGSWYLFVEKDDYISTRDCDIYLRPEEAVSSGWKIAETYPPGNYKAGKDIPAGEYYIEGSGTLVQMQKSSKDYKNYIKSDNYSKNYYVKLSEDDYIYFSSGVIMPVDVKKTKEISGYTLEENTMYKVGKDIPAGTYKIQSLHGKSGYFKAITPGDGEDVNQAESKGFNPDFQEVMNLKLKDGQYVIFEGCTMFYPAATNIKDKTVKGGVSN